MTGVQTCALPICQPNKIPTQSVSTLAYSNYDCQQLVAEAGRVDRRVGELYSSLKQTADNDAVKMGVSLLLFWPALFFLDGNDSLEAQEYSRLKGERQAIEKVSVKSKCGIEFAPIKEQKPKKAVVKKTPF